MPGAARFGDEISHGGNIITASENVITNGLGAARQGDLARCRVHGVVSIVSGSSTVTVNGRPRARVGDLCSCGAVITTGSGDVDVGG